MRAVLSLGSTGTVGDGTGSETLASLDSADSLKGAERDCGLDPPED